LDYKEKKRYVPKYLDVMTNRIVHLVIAGPIHLIVLSQQQFKP